MSMRSNSWERYVKTPCIDEDEKYAPRKLGITRGYQEPCQAVKRYDERRQRAGSGT
jgi:hypothetical protein